ncbi:MAG: NusG domain II-containing protein [Fusobacteriaceae bacterium]
MRNKVEGRFFRKGDLLIYLFLLTFFLRLGYRGYIMEDIKGSTAEIYVDGKLKYIQKLQDEEKNIFVETELGGVNVQMQDKKVRVTASNSPKKLIVKQGWIARPGEILIGIPDKVIVKIIGEGADELDYVAK